MAHLPADPRRFDARFAEIEAEGRELLRSRESRVALKEPFLLAARQESSAIDQTVRLVTLFAFVLSAVVVTLVVVRAAPAPIGLIVLVWVVAALTARAVARRARRALGRVIVDFEQDELETCPLEGPARRVSISGLRGEALPTTDDEAPACLVLHGEGGPIRLCRGVDREIDRVAALLRKYRVEVTSCRPTDGR